MYKMKQETKTRQLFTVVIVVVQKKRKCSNILKSPDVNTIYIVNKELLTLT